MKPDTKKIAFIICINDADAYAECRYYIDRLKLPDGFNKDIITIEDAPSMAAGYNAGMESSNAKYKVYLHQDVMIIDIKFIEKLLKVFRSSNSIGILGCVGATKLSSDAMAVTSWNVGKVVQNAGPLLLEYEEVSGLYAKVEAIDGLLMATQHDVRWREDIMDGWDFYDISQCMEFKRNGYLAVVPRQEQPWCYHDNHSSNMEQYNFYRGRFIKEYAAEGDFHMPPVWEKGEEYRKLKKQSINLMESYIQAGDHTQLHQIFMQPEYRKYMHLDEYKVIADIDYLEQHAQSEKRLWQPGANDAAMLLRKIRKLKSILKRIEYCAESTEQAMQQLLSCYSVYAIAGVFEQYVERRQHVYEEIKSYFINNRRPELEIWMKLQL